MYVAEYERIMKYLARQIKGTRFEGHVYAVGGCVRDTQIAKDEGKAGNIKDIDLVVDLPNGGIELAKYLKEKDRVKGSLVIYETFGTVMFRLKRYPDVELEAVQTRSECYRDENSRDPETSFGTIQQDAFRRDFTINALYYDISNQVQKDFNGHGLDDLRSHVIDTCGTPDIIFNEDPLRIMRAVRFAAKLSYSISDRTVEGIKKYVKRLGIISQERITDEFNKILVTDNSTYGLTKLQDYGIMEVIAPVLCKSLSTEAMIDLYNVSYYLKCHNLYAEQKELPTYDRERMMLSAISYFTGPDEFKELMLKMKYSNDEINEVTNRAKLLESMRKAAVDKDFMALHEIEYKCKTSLEYEKLYFLAKQIREIPFWVPLNPYQEHPLIGYKMPVDGEWVMKTYNLNPGPKVGWVLTYLLKMVFSEPDKLQTLEDFEEVVSSGLLDVGSDPAVGIIPKEGEVHVFGGFRSQQEYFLNKDKTVDSGTLS